MGTIDDKVVAMSFESSKFESGVSKTLSALDKLKAALHFPNAGKGLSDIDAAAKRVDMGHIAQGIEGIKSALGTLRLVGVAALATIASEAVRAGATMLKSLSVGPLIDGFKEYSTNLNAIQTILANTQASGATLNDVNASLNELNRYSDKTIYNFSQMARNIGTFTAAGVDLNTSTAAIKGIANLAALSGSNADQASTAMYQLSQAIAAGSVKLQDWNSVVNAGMGGTVFQRALAMTAEKMGTLKEGTVKLTGPMKNVTIAGEAFRQSLSTPGKASWLTSKVLTQTLKQFTGDLSDAQLKAEGFNAAEIKAIQQTAKTAQHAATEVKTISQVFDVAKETAGSGWAQTFQIIFGNFNEAKKTFTAMSNAINGFINTNANARNKVLADWKALGGRTVLLNSIKVAFHNLGLIIAPIKEAFRDIFPAATGKSLFDLTLKFQNFAKALKPSADTVNNLKSTFRGLFAFLDIGKQIISGIVSMFGKMFGAMGVGSGGILHFTGNIGDMIYAFDQSLKKGNVIGKFFESLGGILAKPVQFISHLADIIGNLFGKFSPGGFIDKIHQIVNATDPMGKAFQVAQIAWDNFAKSIRNSIDVKAIGQKIFEVFSQIGVAIGHAASTMNFESILAVIRTGLFGALVVMFKKFLGNGSFLQQISKGFKGGLLHNFSGLLGGLSGSLTTFQNNVRAKTLKEIAISIALLSASIVGLSLANPQRVSKAMGSMTIMFGELLGAMAVLDKIAKSGAFLKLPVMAAGLILLASAIDILTVAVIAMSLLSWDQLKKGLTGVGALLGGITVAAAPLTASSAGMIRAGVGITGIAIGLNIMALAVRQLGNLNMAELSKGLLGVSVGLAAIAGVMTVMPKGMILQSVALNAIAVSLNVMAAAMSKFANLSWQQIAKGMAGLAGGLLIIAGAMNVMPKTMIVQAAGLVVVSLALGKIADAIAKMGGLSMKAIGKGLLTLAGALIILAAGLTVMSGTLGGAAALTVAAAGIMLLSKALVRMGGMSWKQIIKGLVVLAAALGIIAVAALALTPATPALLAFGLAMLGIGAGLALAGVGIFLISAGLSALAVAAPTAAGVMVAAMVTLVKGVIDNAKLLVLAVLSIVDAIAATAPRFVAAAITIIKALLDGIVKIAPMLVPAINALIQTILDVIGQNQDKIIAAGLSLLIALLQGIKANIQQVVRLVADIIVRFIQALSQNLNRIVAAGLQLLVSLVKGVMNGIGQIPTAVVQIITRFLASITSNLTKIVTAGGQMIIKLVEGIGKTAQQVVTAGTKAIVGFINAVGRAGPQLVTAGTNAAVKLITAIATAIPGAALKVYQAVRAMIVQMAFVIGLMVGDFSSLGIEIGIAFMHGLIDGMTSWYDKVIGKIHEIGGKLKSAWHSVTSVFSPSKITVYIGQMLMQGLIVGMDDYGPKVYNQVVVSARAVREGFQSVLGGPGPSQPMALVGQDVIKGFIQGLKGATPDIVKAFTDLNNSLTTTMATARANISKESDHLKELMSADKYDFSAIQKSEQIIAQNEQTLMKATLAHGVLNKVLDGERATLVRLSKDYETVSKQLEAAQQKLAAAKAEMASFTTELENQYGALPAVPPPEGENGETVNQLQEYEDALQKQAEAAQKYSDTLKQLRDLGLDDATYEKLLKEGPSAQAFASSILAGGQEAVNRINELDKTLKTASNKIATEGAKQLKQAGVDAAQGLVTGLASQKKEIAGAMAVLIADIIAIIRKELGIKSPSTVMMGIGNYMAQGLAVGLSSAGKMVADAATGLVDGAMTAMNKSINAMSDMVMGNIDSNPVITPVLDLTMVKAQAKELGYLTNVTPITAAASYGQASQISAAQARSFEEQQIAAAGTTVKFEQNNYSPTALTEIEIYRQTKNLLGQQKSALS